MASIPEEDKARVRNHLGYPNSTAVVAGEVGGVVYAANPHWAIESAMDKVTDYSITMIQRTLGYLDRIEAQQIDALERLQATRADVVTLNPMEHAELLNQYKYWQGRLATQVGCKINPFQEGSGVSLNIRHMR